MGDKKKHDGSYFEVNRRNIRRSMMIIVPIAVAIALVVGLTAVYGAGTLKAGKAMVMHVHPQLNVTVDGNPMIVPTQIGIDSLLWKDHSLDQFGMQGMAPLHTHDTSGTIHVESNTIRNYTLGQFLDIWGGLNVVGKTVKATVDGKPVSDFRNIILTDGEKINLQVGK
jgi:hypothetical protein